MIYFTELDAADQDNLYRALIEKVEPALLAEKTERDCLEAEFQEATKAERIAFETSIQEPFLVAEEAYKPLKAACDAACKVIIERSKRLIDKAVAKLAKDQAGIQKVYDEATSAQRVIYDDAVRPLKEEYEAKIAALGAKVQEQIKPINEEYYALAAQLDSANKTFH